MVAGKGEKPGKRGEKHQAKHAELSDDAGEVVDNLQENKAPKDPDQAAKSLEDEAK